MPPSTSSAFSSTSWLDFFLLSRTGNLVVAAAVLGLVAIAMLVAQFSRRDPGPRDPF